MADKERLTAAIDDCIRALQELKRVWEEADTDSEALMQPTPQVQPVPPAPEPAPAVSPAPEPVIPNQQIAPAVDTTDRAYNPNACSKCGAPLTPGAKFCLTCGNPVGPTAGMMTPPAGAPGKFCSKCGAPITPGNKFCMECGTPVQ